MTVRRRLRLLTLALLCCLLALAGCAKKMPVTEALAPAAHQEATALFAEFVSRRPPAVLDADLHLTWEFLGVKGGVDATVQLQQPARIRFSANDPLGRALSLLVSDGLSFTMVDNRAGKVYRGTTDSKFWHTRVPEAVQAEDLLPLLAGSGPAGGPADVQPAGDGMGAGFWYLWTDARAYRHHMLLERHSGRLLRHLLVDRSGKQVLDLIYAEYAPGEGGFAWPGRVEVAGEAVGGSVVLRFEKVFSRESLPASTFQLTPPAHFTIEEVD